MKRRIDEGTAKMISDMLLEKFGEPIGKAIDVGPGVADERNGHPERGEEEEGNHGFGAPCCDQCGGMMPMEGVTCSSCDMMSEHLNEARGQLSSREVLTTWEDLYVNSRQNRRKHDIQGLTPGVVTFDELVSWLGSSEQAVKQAMIKAGLLIDKNGNVVERGMAS